MIRKVGEFIDCIIVAVKQHNAVPDTQIFVREGDHGPLRSIQHIKIAEDQRGRCIVVQIPPRLLS